MRLTKSDRDAFVSAVMDDVPSVDYRGQAHALVREDAVNQLPKKVKEVYEDDSLKKYLDRVSVYLNDQFHSAYVVGPEYKMSSAVAAKIKELAEKHKEQDKRRRVLKDSLKSAILACNTLKQAKERMPEFEKYLPADRDSTGTSNLPAISNLVTDLMLAGWRGGKETPKAMPKRVRKKKEAT